MIDIDYKDLVELSLMLFIVALMVVILGLAILNRD